METINIIAHTKDASQIEAIKAFMKALKIKFEVSKEKGLYGKVTAKPNKETLKAITNIEAGKGLTRTKSHADLMEKLNS
ncbi:hypothetical protein G5B30_04900 [Sphingobacterium sp. SGG-5]|uniref:DUF2683 family protein n=1 Tax=Sphingobacterium sp. SGG-5 TaxID=2710881 RepID=UPI0013EB9FDD|nr:DUF2683 family protein [Sphingobacterium sp. SGG-5]NGM61254.1 hypothetical protein [Sphingobacterium sp. SGG-5]